MLEKLRATAEVLKGTLEGHLFKEHHIRFSDNLINETLKANLGKISVATGNDFRRLEIQSCPDYVTISGRATRKLVAADFSLRVLLLDPVWGNDHQLRFEVLDTSLEIDKTGVRGILAALGATIFGIVTGESVFNARLRGMSDDEGAVVFSLDGLNEGLDHAIKYLELKQIIPGDGDITVIAQVRKEDLKGISKGLLARIGQGMGSTFF